VPTVPVVQPTGFLGRGGGSGQQFKRRQAPSATTKAAEARQTDPKSGAETVVYCPTGEPTKTTATNAKGIATTTFACPPAPAPPPNVTRFDPPTGRDRDAYEKYYRISLADYDTVGEIDAPRSRTHRKWGLFAPAHGDGDVIAKLHENPRDDWAWGRHFELYGEAFRQQALGIGPGGVAAGQPGYGAAGGAVLDAFRFRDWHFQPLLEGGWVAGTGYVRIGARVPLCIGAECP
jgi:hypothetical protein